MPPRIPRRPEEQPLLNCAWVRDAFEPIMDVCHDYTGFQQQEQSEAPRCICTSAATRCGRSRRVGARPRLCRRTPAARHPNTARRAGEWPLPTPPDGSRPFAADFHLRHEGTNPETQPFSLEDIGYDFFLRVKTTKLFVWFVDPATGETVHSGAKSAAPRASRSATARSASSASANNFVSQHLKNLHTPPPPTALPSHRAKRRACASGRSGGGHAPGAMPVGYQLESSTDNARSGHERVSRGHQLGRAARAPSSAMLTERARSTRRRSEATAAVGRLPRRAPLGRWSITRPPPPMALERCA